MRLDILYFLDHNIDDPLPWHSTLGRTRQLFTEDVFAEVFTKVLKLCIEAGLVSGHTQAIDSAPVKANASMDSLEIKVPAEELEEHLSKVRVQTSRDRKAKGNKAPKNNKQSQPVNRNSRRSKAAIKMEQRPGYASRSQEQSQQIHQQQNPL